MPPKNKVNLLPKDEFESSPTGKLVKWAASAGRWVVVLTEFIVICAFLSRFYFDTVLANLFDEIKQKQYIVESASAFEETFVEVQEKAKVVKILLAEGNKPSEITSEISQLVPLNVTLTEVIIKEDQLNIKGYALSEGGLNLFLQGLLRHPRFEEVNLSNVAPPKDTGVGIGFNISTLIKPI